MKVIILAVSIYANQINLILEKTYSPISIEILYQTYRDIGNRVRLSQIYELNNSGINSSKDI